MQSRYQPADAARLRNYAVLCMSLQSCTEIKHVICTNLLRVLSHAMLPLLGQERLDQIDSKRTNGIFGGDLTHVPPGQATCSKLLHDCHRLVEVAQRSAATGSECAPLADADPYKHYKAVSECYAAHEE